MNIIARTTCAAALVLYAGANTICADQMTQPEALRLIDSIHSAFASPDARRLSELVEFRAQADDGRTNLERANEFVERGGTRACDVMKAALEGLSLLTVDHELRWPGAGMTTMPTDVVRVVFRVPVPAEVTSRLGESRVLRAFFFVHRDGQWKWRMGSMVPWAPWEYKLDAPESSYNALLAALDARLYHTVHELVDPEILPDIPVDRWVATVAQRTAEMDAIDAQNKIARRAATAKHERSPKCAPPPFVAVGQVGYGAQARFANDDRNVAHLSNLWDKADRLKGPVPYEVFVKRGERWYWQPRPEYTLWPRKTNTPAASQPAAEPAERKP